MRIPDYLRATLLGIGLVPAVVPGCLPTAAWPAVAAQRIDLMLDLDIPAQALANALRALAAQSDLQVLVPTEIVAGKYAPGVKGRLTPRHALDQLLQGSGLEYEVVDGRTINVKRRPTLPPIAASLQTANTREHIEPEYADGAQMLEEVIVTAQKREERLQDVPIAISAFTAEQIAARGVSSVFDLGAATPNLQISRLPESTTTPQIAIRGRTEVNSTLHLGQPVGLYIDGVYLGTVVGSALDLLELERIEVLRGPQGTLFGRNTLAGAVSFISKKPSGVFGGSASVDAGNYNLRIARLNVDLPKVGVASVSVAGRIERRDGWQELVGGGPQSEASDRHNQGGRVVAKFDFNDDLDALYAFDISTYDQSLPASSLYHTNPAFWAAVGLNAFNDYVTTDRDAPVAIEAPSFEKIRITGHALTVNWRLSEDNAFKSVTAFRDLNGRGALDLDKTPLNVATQLETYGAYAHPGNYEQWSQEFQLVGNTERLNYVGGLYYFQNKGSSGGAAEYFCDTAFGCFGTVQTGSSKLRAYAAYGQLDFKVTDALTMTAGIRYNTERQEGVKHTDVPSLPDASGKVTSSRTTPLATVAYKLSDQLNVYAKYSEGFKSGGINPEGNIIDGALPTFKPEIGKTIELGAKMSSANGRAWLNAAVFQNKMSDLQLNVYIPDADGIPRTTYTNAGKATARGVELEGAFIPVDGIRLQASYGYLDSKYDEYIDNGVNQARNRAMPHAPKNTLNALVDARLAQTTYGTVRAIVDYTYTDDYYSYPYQLASSGSPPEFDPTQTVARNTQVRSVGFANARLVMSEIPFGGDGDGELALWVRNLTDEEHVSNYIDFGPSFGELISAYWDEPRTYGVTLAYRW